MLIERLAQKLDGQKAEAKRFLDAFIETIEQSLKAGNQVALTGFGTFRVTERKARKGMNPVTGKPMSIAAKWVPKFTAGKTLKEEVGSRKTSKS